MTALELIELINLVLFVGLFVVALRHALRSPSRAKLNIALLFGSIAGVLALSRIADALGIAGHPAYPGVIVILVALAPFAMLRLVDDFSASPAAVQVGGAAGFVLLGAIALVAFGPLQQLVALLVVMFFVLVGGYAAFSFARETRRSRGLTRRRMAAVTVGAVLFIAAITIIFGDLALEASAESAILPAQIIGLAAAIAFFLGFAPPTLIRRGWREPDLRRFLERSLALAAESDDERVAHELASAAASAFGAAGATIGLADPERRVLRYVRVAGGWIEFPDDVLVGGRSFQLGTRVVVPDTEAEDPEHAAVYRASGARAAIAAPITTDARRLGVLSVFAERMSIFVEDDLWLIDLLADQCAVLLEARELAHHATELRAREEAARMKEEFLSAAAHDLRTPLTVVLGQAELLERRHQRKPDAPVDAQGLARLTREARRLSDLVTELLDARRLEQGKAVMELVPTDLLGVLEDVGDRYADAGVRLRLGEPVAPLVAAADRPRIEQVLDNLVENAIKYTTVGDPPELRASTVDGEVHVAVVDHGIGIPEMDRSRVFERFFRASNALGITDTGLGLGLYICRRIVEEHGGRVWFEETPGGGTTFTVALPLLAVPHPEPQVTGDDQPWEIPAREAPADA